ncbi:hypothetical protein OFD71_35700, partial [Escherichia coli]|nr:hypothetical protein [Escherichia coli]
QGHQDSPIDEEGPATGPGAARTPAAGQANQTPSARTDRGDRPRQPDQKASTGTLRVPQQC